MASTAYWVMALPANIGTSLPKSSKLFASNFQHSPAKHQITSITWFEAKCTKRDTSSLHETDNGMSYMVNGADVLGRVAMYAGQIGGVLAAPFAALR